MSIHTAYKFRHYNGDNKLLWASTLGEVEHENIYKGTNLDLYDVQGSQEWMLNALADEGEKDILDVYFDVQAVRANLYGRLYTEATPAETDTLATLAAEVSGTGYGAVTFARGTDWGAPALDAGDMMTTSTTKTFTATGTWTGAVIIVLSTVSTGTAGLLIAYSALSATRTLQNGDTLDVSFTVKLA